MTTVISSGQTQKIQPHMHVSGVVLRGGTQVVSSAGSATATLISSGGRQLVQSGAFVVGTIVDSGGLETVLSEGVVKRTTISGGGTMVVSGGRAFNTVIQDGGFQRLISGAETLHTVIQNGGRQDVGFQAAAGDTRVENGGIQELGPDADVGGTTVYAGGTLIVGKDSLATDSLIKKGGTLDLINEGDFSGRTEAGAIVNLQRGEIGQAPTVSKGVRYTVDSGAHTNSVTVATGGKLTVLHGGAAGAYMQANASVFDAGIVGGTAVSGDTVMVASGGQLDMTISSGAMVTVASGGSVGGVLEGGVENVDRGAEFTNAVGLDSGTLRVVGSNLAFETGEFRSAAKLDLPSFAFGPKETVEYVQNNNFHGTLTVVDGAKEAKVTVLTVFPQYVAAGFQVASDGAGGSVVTYTPPMSSSHIALAGPH